MESETTPSSADARLALRQAANVTAAVVARSRAPLWYHPALGLLIGGLLAAQAAPLLFASAYLGLFVCGLAGLVATYRGRAGMWINGYRAGRTRIVAVATAGIAVVLMLACVLLSRGYGLWWAPLAGAPILALLVTASGFVWEAAFRADLSAAANGGGRA